jgi:hypothetical protein
MPAGFLRRGKCLCNQTGSLHRSEWGVRARSGHSRLPLIRARVPYLSHIQRCATHCEGGRDHLRRCQVGWNRSAQRLARHVEIVRDGLGGDPSMSHCDLGETGKAEERRLPPVLAASCMGGARHWAAQSEPEIPPCCNAREREPRAQQCEALRQGAPREGADERIVEVVVVGCCAGDLGWIRLCPTPQGSMRASSARPASRRPSREPT